MARRLEWTTFAGALLCGCTGHGAYSDSAEVVDAPTVSSTSVAEAIRMTNVAIPDCIEDSFAAEERSWDGATWWNVECRTGHTLTSITYASSWVRQDDGHYIRGGRWTASTQPAWLDNALEYPAKVAIERAEQTIGDGAQLECDSYGPLLLHAFSLSCADRNSDRLYEVVVDPGTGAVRAGPNPVQLMLEQMRAQGEH